MGDSVKTAVRVRLLKEMLGGVKDGTGGGWKVLVLDAFTTKVMSSSCRMSDILDTGVSVVEDLSKTREPLALAAVYFIQPSPESVDRMLKDFAKNPLYPSVHIFFSSQVSSEAVEKIKRTPKLVERLRTLKEVNVEFLVADSRTVVTDHPQAMVKLMGERADTARLDGEREVEQMVLRVATLMTTLGDYPCIRYKQAKPAEPSDPPGAQSRSQLTQRVAAKLSARFMELQRKKVLPLKETCDLLVLDRSIDPVAPIIHDFTYDPLVYDLLPMDGNVYRYKSTTNAGKTEEVEAVVDESDELWVEMRHAFIAEVFKTTTQRMTELQAKNKVAKVALQGTSIAQLSNMNAKALIQALPQFRELINRLSLHINISSDINMQLTKRNLNEIGMLEQELVYGDKTSKELIQFLADHSASLDTADKMRLFLCYLATHPEKLDATKHSQWAKLARLSAHDMNTVCNLAYLGVNVMKTNRTGTSALTFGRKDKRAKGVRRAKETKEGEYALSRFDPLLYEVIEDLARNSLSSEEYPYVRPPAEADDFGTADSGRVASARTNRPSMGANWATKGGGNWASGAAGAPGAAMGRRLVVLVIGGVSRSEMRVVHQLAKSLNKDIVLVSTCVDTPLQFIDKLSQLSTVEGLMQV